MKFKVFISIMAAICVIMFGFIAYRTMVNNQRCEAKLGHGASWTGDDVCVPLGVHTHGLMDLPWSTT